MAGWQRSVQHPKPLPGPTWSWRRQIAGHRRTRAGARWRAADALAAVSSKHSVLLKVFVAAVTRPGCAAL